MLWPCVGRGRAAGVLTPRPQRWLVPAGGGRTDLSGSAAEAQALSEQFRSAAEQAAASVVIDERAWERSAARRPPPPMLSAVQQAVINGQQLLLRYTSREREHTERVVEPLGIAARGTSWYLVADTAAGRRSSPVDRIEAATPTGEPVTRPEGFDLGEVWAIISERVDELRAPVLAHALARQAARRPRPPGPRVGRDLRGLTGERVTAVGRREPARGG